MEAVSALTATVGLQMLLPARACLRLPLCLFQVCLLQSQLARHGQDDLDNSTERCAWTRLKLSDLHHELSYPFAAVLKEPQAAVLEAET